MNADSLQFSVAVPVGKEDERLAIALRSLVLQNARLHIALLDASGSQQIRDIARQFEGALAARLHRPDEGQAAAIRDGWAQAGGEILCWLNADDTLLPGALREVAGIFAASPETDVVYGHSVLVDSQGRITGYHMAVDEMSDALYRTNVISQPSCFVRRKAVEDVGGIDPDLHFVMDWDLWIRLHRAGKVFRFADAPFSNVVWETGTKTASVSPRRLFEIFNLVRRYAGIRYACDTIVGVLSHHLGNYTLFAGLRRKFRLHHPLSLRKSIAGFDRDGGIADTANIPLANFDTAARSAIVVRFENANGGLEALAVGDQPATGAHGDLMQVDLDEPIPPGGIAWIRIRAASGGALRFIDAGWCDDGDSGLDLDRS